jgi:alpha-mannosidase
MRFSNKGNSLKKLRIKKPTAFCMPGFYADPVGRWTQAESVEANFPLIREYLLACRADPFYGVYFSEIDILKPYLDLYPEERAWIARLIQQERCCTGGAYNQPNETSIGGEALIRNILIGQLYHKTILGSETPVYMSWNAHGHIPQLPQILYQCGMVATIFCHCNFINEKKPIPGMPTLFVWTAPNGSWVYAKRMNHEIKEEGNLVEYANHVLINNLELFPDINAVLLLDAGIHEQPRARMIGNCRDLTEEEPSLILTGDAATKYFSYIDTLYNKDQIELEAVSRDITQCSEAGEITRIDLKIANRLAENLLYDVEMWGSVGKGFGIPYASHRVDKAWRQLLFGQHHNAITGFVNELAFVDLLEGYREALEIAEHERHRTLRAFASMIDTQAKNDKDSIIVFNSLPWMRDGLVRQWIEVEKDFTPFALQGSENESIPFEIEQIKEDDAGQPSNILALWMQNDLPPAGYETISIHVDENLEMPYLKESLSQTWLENDFLRIEIDPDRGGGIISILDKVNQKEVINQKHDQPANDVMALAEGSDAWPQAHLMTTKDKILGSAYRADVNYMEGAVSSRLIVKGKGPGPCSRIQEIRLYKNTPCIDCLTLLENYQGYQRKKTRAETEKVRDLYVVAFPLDLPGSVPVLEDRFYAKAFRRSKNFMHFSGNADTNESQHGMNACYRWMDVSWTYLIRFMNGNQEIGSLAVGPSEIVYSLAEHRHSLEVLTLYLAQHGVTCTPRRDKENISTDLLYRQMSFSLGTREDNIYTNKLLESNTKAQAFYVQCMEEFGYAILAVSDTCTAPGQAPRPALIIAGKNASLTKFALDEIVQSTSSHQCEIPARACFLTKLNRIEDYGFALMNRGNMLCSLEEDGTAALGLMHTVPYVNARTPWSFDFAEGKSSVFQYRILPHRGDWRLAEIPRRAMEYNHEAFSLLEPSHSGSLPPRSSFFSVEPRNVLVSCIKPTGFPEAEYKSPESYSPGTTIRLYEAHGEQSNIWLESQNAVRSIKLVGINEKPLRLKRDVYREEQYIRTVVNANEIINFNLELKQPGKAPYKPVDAEPLPIRYAPSRYWRYNLGAAPDGFLPLTLSLRGASRMHSDAKETIHHLDLVIVNNSPYDARHGEIEILTPPYWRIIPTQLRYKIQAGMYQILPIHLLVEEPGHEGFIKVRTMVNDMIIEDIVHIGKPPEFDLTMTLTRDGFNVKLKHEYEFEISGSLSLITPIESWPAEIVGEYSLSSIAPHKQDFTLPSMGKVTLSYPIDVESSHLSTAGDHFWIIIKLAAHNTIRYYHVRLDGRKSEGLGQILHPPYTNLPRFQQ